MIYETRYERAGRLLLGGFMMTAGVLHFTSTDTFAAMVPDYLPSPRALVYVSGVAELALGAGVMVERTRRLAAIGLVALFLAVFPANIYWAMHPEIVVPGLPSSFPHPSAAALWLRLPLQLVLIVWALRCARSSLTT